MDLATRSVHWQEWNCYHPCSGPVTLTAGDIADTTFSGTISNGAGVLALTKVGAGTLTLSGTNTYSGGTTVAGGVVSVAADANLGNIAGGINLAGGELLTTVDGFISGRTVTLSSTGSALAAAVGTTAKYDGIVSGIGGLKIGDGVHAGTVFLTNGAQLL